MKTAIICGRAWSSYLSRALMRSGLLRHWLPVHPTDKWDTQPDVKRLIRDKWVTVKAADLVEDAERSMIAQGLADWDVVKCPEFSLVVAQLVEAFPGIRFIVIDRDLEARVQSSMRVDSTGWIMKSIARDLPLRELMHLTLNIPEGGLITSPMQFEEDKELRDRVQEEAHVRAWWLFSDIMRERALNYHVKPENVLRLSFDYCQRESRAAMSRIATFLCHPQISVDPDTGQAVNWLDQWEEMRKGQWQFGARPEYHLQEEGT